MHRTCKLPPTCLRLKHYHSEIGLQTARLYTANSRKPSFLRDTHFDVTAPHIFVGLDVLLVRSADADYSCHDAEASAMGGGSLATLDSHFVLRRSVWHRRWTAACLSNAYVTPLLRTISAVLSCEFRSRVYTRAGAVLPVP